MTKYRYIIQLLGGPHLNEDDLCSCRLITGVTQDHIEPIRIVIMDDPHSTCNEMFVNFLVLFAIVTSVLFLIHCQH